MPQPLFKTFHLSFCPLYLWFETTREHLNFVKGTRIKGKGWNCLQEWAEATKAIGKMNISAILAKVIKHQSQICFKVFFVKTIHHERITYLTHFFFSCFFSTSRLFWVREQGQSYKVCQLGSFIVELLSSLVIIFSCYFYLMFHPQ